ncbi:cancer-related nucleoside-triphosphatase [Phlebotomus argentipes]|uniref:cancer-related nucleoside-triphosphatase n=1 Tax=Phlebotomus argentipes TaxID=94469 RepID=UPI0028933BB7|nr:cancer-related nucleoside-triphosphatase [Phlebotomus argentipes]
MVFNLILITGVPGVGKTTILKKIADDLKSFKVPLTGFYTEEVRNGLGGRVGFDIVTFDGQRGPLARPSKTSALASFKRLHKLSRYSVDIESLDQIAVPILFNNNIDPVLLIDEIGKMELFSTQFQDGIVKITEDLRLGRRCMIATIPITSPHSSDIIQNLKKIDNCQVFEITKANRNNIYPDIMSSVRRMLNI